MKRKDPPVVTEFAILRAYAKCFNRLGRRGLTSTTSSAGFLITSDAGKPRAGWQVFVKMVKYSDRRLAEDPDSGGLEEHP